MLAQESTKQQDTIFEALLANQPGNGTIAIKQSQHIMQLVGKPSSALSGAKFYNGYAVLQGYKVQLYSGNNTSSKNIARTRASEVREHFPDLETAVEFEAPFWRLRVGSFIEFSEARECMMELKKQFPAFSKEVYIVRSTIRIKQ